MEKSPIGNGRVFFRRICLLIVFEFFGDRRGLLLLSANDTEPGDDVNQDKSASRNELGIPGPADPTEASLERIAAYFHVEKSDLLNGDDVRRIALDLSGRERAGFKATDITLLISSSVFGLFGLITIVVSFLVTPCGPRDDNFSELSVEAMNGLVWFKLGIYGVAIGLALLAVLGIRRAIVSKKNRVK